MRCGRSAGRGGGGGGGGGGERWEAGGGGVCASWGHDPLAGAGVRRDLVRRGARHRATAGPAAAALRLVPAGGVHHARTAVRGFRERAEGRGGGRGRCA